jgi:HlyD family secretion protein
VDPRDALTALKIDREQTEREGKTARQSTRWLWAGTVLVVLAAIAAAAAWWWMRPGPVLVRTSVVTADNGVGPTAALNASGYVVAQQEATVAAEITGMVTAVNINEGDRVAAGQILARLDDSAARGTVESAESQLQADRELLPQYEAPLDRDRRMLERSVTLVREAALSQASLESAEAAVKVDQSQLDHAEGQVAVDEKNLALDNTLLSYTVIRAPFAGVVTERYAHPGEMISPQAVGGFTQTGICKLVDMQSLEIDVDVNEAYIQRVHEGQKVEAVLDAYPGGTMPAHVISVVPTANQHKATVKVRIGFDRLDPRILPQMGVQVSFVSAAAVAPPVAGGGIRIPTEALHGESGRQFVYLAEDGRVRLRSLVARPMRNGQAIVLSGLDGGERLIVSADAPLHEGEEIREP